MLDDVKGREPFALVVDCFDPHEPWSPPRKYLDMYGDPDYTGPEVGVTRYGLSGYLSKDELRRLRAVYAAELTMTDRWLGHFMDRFYELGLDENTVVRAAERPRLPARRPRLRGQGALRDAPGAGAGPVRRGPPRRAGPPARCSSHFASTHDVGPTLLSAVGVDPPDYLEGSDLSPLLDGKEPAEKRDFHYGGMYNRFYIRTDDWALIADTRGQERKLYDLTLDKFEIHNVVDRYPKVARGALPAGALERRRRAPPLLRARGSRAGGAGGVVRPMRP